MCSMKISNGEVQVLDREGSTAESIPLSCFQKLYTDFLGGGSCGSGNGGQTPEIEADAKRLRQKNFPKKDTIKFIRKTCEWGGITGYRVWGNIESINRRDNWMEFVHQVRESDKCLQNNDIRGGYKEITYKKKGLGCSYGSKVLRMLCPALCGALDTRLMARLFYKEREYISFCEHCMDIANALNKAAIPNPRPRGGKWRVGDVESAIFTYISQKYHRQ